MTQTAIKQVFARQVLDCKCRPMVEVDILTEGGFSGQGSAPTGSSVGMYESYVLRDHNPKEYHGMSVHTAVKNITDIIAPAIIGMDVLDQAAIDKKMLELDGTADKHHLGGNAIYSVSIAAYRAAAASRHKELYEYIADGNIKTVPVPSFNVVNGGKNGSITQAFNEFIIVPYKADSIEEAVEIGVNVFQQLEDVISAYSGSPAMIGRSYGWCAPSSDPKVVLDLIQKAVDLCGYRDKVAFALDCAISDFYDKAANTYLVNEQHLTTDELIAYVKNLTELYNFVFIEDMLDENDWTGYQKAHREITKTLIIGDDFCVSNPARIKKAYELNAIDGFILKPNQVGTITEALEAHRFGVEHQLLSITSGRSGGVVNDVVMDLAVGLQIGFIKNGCPRSGERISKLNFLLRVCSLHEGCRMADISDVIKF